jgi:hypothetical protein
VTAKFDIGAAIRGMGRDKARGIAAVTRALDIVGEHVLGDAQQLCPVDTGFLQSTGTTSPAELRGNLIVKEIGFGAEYAIFVHEDMTAHHEVGQAKYLETAIRQNEERVFAFVAGEVRKVL